MTLAYIIQTCKGDQPFLCVRGNDGKFYTFDLDMQNVARLAQECTSIIAAEMGQLDWKRSGQEVTALWARNGHAPSDP